MENINKSSICIEHITVNTSNKFLRNSSDIYSQTITFFNDLQLTSGVSEKYFDFTSTRLEMKISVTRNSNAAIFTFWKNKIPVSNNYINFNEEGLQEIRSCLKDRYIKPKTKFGLWSDVLPSAVALDSSIWSETLLTCGEVSFYVAYSLLLGFIMENKMP